MSTRRNFLAGGGALLLAGTTKVLPTRGSGEGLISTAEIEVPRTSRSDDE